MFKLAPAAIASALLFLSPFAHAEGFAPADSFRTLTQVLPGKRPGENSVTLRWAPVSCVNGYAVHLSRSEDMAKARVSTTGKRPYLNFPTTASGNFYWQVGCRGEQSAQEAGVETQLLEIKPKYLPAVVPEALTRRVVRKEGSGDSLPLAGTDPSYRHRLEVFSPRLEPLSARESTGDDAFWPSLSPGFYYYRVVSMNAQGQETYGTPLSVLQVEGGPGAGTARGAAAGSKGFRISAGGGFVGQTGTQTSQRVSGDLSSGTTPAGNIRVQWNWNPRWGVDVRALFTKASYNDANNNYVATDFQSGEYRAVAQSYLPSENKFWILGIGLGSRNHPFVQVEGFKLTVAGVRTTEVVVRGGVEWRPERWQHTVTVDLMAPVKFAVAGLDTVKGSISPTAEIELTSYYSFGKNFSLGGFIGGRISNTKFSYTAANVSEEVTIKFSRVMGGVLASYRL
jgi:hypothetical protein